MKGHLLTNNPDFTAFAHPVLAVACPKCGCRPGRACNSQRLDWSSDYHLERKTLAGEMFLDQHGENAEISRVEGVWIINPGAPVVAYSNTLH